MGNTTSPFFSSTSHGTSTAAGRGRPVVIWRNASSITAGTCSGALDARGPLREQPQSCELVRQLMKVARAGSDALRRHLAREHSTGVFAAYAVHKRRGRIQNARPGNHSVDTDAPVDFAYPKAM